MLSCSGRNLNLPEVKDSRKSSVTQKQKGPLKAEHPSPVLVMFNVIGLPGSQKSPGLFRKRTPALRDANQTHLLKTRKPPTQPPVVLPDMGLFVFKRSRLQNNYYFHNGNFLIKRGKGKKKNHSRPFIFPCLFKKVLRNPQQPEVISNFLLPACMTGRARGRLGRCKGVCRILA